MQTTAQQIGSISPDSDKSSERYSFTTAKICTASAPFRDDVFRGALIEAINARSFDRELSLRGREELLSCDQEVEQIVREELVARIRRIGRDRWRDLREQGSALVSSRELDVERLPKVEVMLRYIAEHALGPINIEGCRCRTSSEFRDDGFQEGCWHDNASGPHRTSARHRAVSLDLNRTTDRFCGF